MLTTGAQLRAARALAGLTQVDLASRAKVDPSTIVDMEARGAAVLRSSLETVRAVQVALEAAGIEFLNGDQPGVRMKASKG
jgi:transcriptional regulator with XRE-family HTH domain